MSIAGVRLRLHPLFTLIMAASVLTGYFTELLTLFVIVVIHELGHAACAVHLGWKVREIQLMPFGGVVVAEQAPMASALDELRVALAGPLQNIWMIGLALLFGHIGIWTPEWSDYFLKANLMLALFNLIPALPLDGGKVMQALFSLWMPYYRSLQWSVHLSLGMSLFITAYALFAPYGTGVQLNLLMIGLFLLYSNWMVLRHLPFQFMRFLMHRPYKVAELLRRGVEAEPIVVSASAKLQDLLRQLKRDRHHIYIMRNSAGRTAAILPELRLISRYLESPAAARPPS